MSAAPSEHRMLHPAGGALLLAAVTAMGGRASAEPESASRPAASPPVVTRSTALIAPEAVQATLAPLPGSGSAPGDLAGSPTASRRPGRSGREAFPAPSLALAYHAGSDTVDTEIWLPRQPERPVDRFGPGRAFEQELREESLRYMDSSPWALVPYELDDDTVREGRERAAERVLGRALEASFDHVIGRPDGDGRVRLGVRSGIVMDESPSWTLRKRTERSSMRLELPLTLSAIKFHAWKEVSSGNGPNRVGTTFAIDPFDESARATFSFSF